MKFSVLLITVCFFSFFSCKKNTPSNSNSVLASIQSFSPSTGAIGSTITVTGSHFTGTTSITINGTTVTNYTVVNDSTIIFTVPTGATTGAVTITNGAGTYTGGTFTVGVSKLVAYS